MKLAYEGFNELLTFREGEVYVITIENIKLFRNLIQDLLNDYNGLSEKILLSENQKQYKLNKICEYVIDPFNMDINQRKVLQKFYAELQELSVNEMFYERSNVLKAEICNYVHNLVFESKYNGQYNLDFEIKDLLSAVKLHLTEEGDSLLEQIDTYLKVCNDFLNTKIVFFVNLSDYLTKDELKQLFRQAAYRKMNLILLERRYIKKIDNEKLLLLDDDLCVIHCDN